MAPWGIETRFEAGARELSDLREALEAANDHLDRAKNKRNAIGEKVHDTGPEIARGK